MDEPLITRAEIAAERQSGQRALNVVQVAMACIQRVDHGAGKPYTLDEATEQVAHPLTFLSKSDLPTLLAYLACQVVGYQRSQNADAVLAMSNIAKHVDEWRVRHLDGYSRCWNCGGPVAQRSSGWDHIGDARCDHPTVRDGRPPVHRGCADCAEKIAQAIEASEQSGHNLGWRTLHAAIARAHATTEGDHPCRLTTLTGEDHHA